MDSQSDLGTQICSGIFPKIARGEDQYILPVGKTTRFVSWLANPPLGAGRGRGNGKGI